MGYLNAEILFISKCLITLQIILFNVSYISFKLYFFLDKNHLV